MRHTPATWDASAAAACLVGGVSRVQTLKQLVPGCLTLRARTRCYTIGKERLFLGIGLGFRFTVCLPGCLTLRARARCYTIGKERLFLEVARALQRKASCPPSMTVRLHPIPCFLTHLSRSSTPCFPLLTRDSDLCQALRGSSGAGRGAQLKSLERFCPCPTTLYSVHGSAAHTLGPRCM